MPVLIGGLLIKPIRKLRQPREVGGKGGTLRTHHFSQRDNEIERLGAEGRRLHLRILIGRGRGGCSRAGADQIM